MLHKTFLSAYAIVLGLATIVTPSVFAQKKAEVTVQSTSESTSMQTFRAKEVLGSKVSIDGNMSIGKVDDIVFDGEGYIEYLIVDNDGKLVTVPWEAAKFNFKERTATVKITNEQFRRVPTYTVDKYPVFTTPDYRVETYKYYGLTPRERRVERRVDRRN